MRAAILTFAATLLLLLEGCSSSSEPTDSRGMATPGCLVNDQSGGVDSCMEYLSSADQAIAKSFCTSFFKGTWVNTCPSGKVLGARPRGRTA